MRDIKRLKLLHQIAKRKTEVAAQLVSQAYRSLELEGKRLKEIEAYKEDYLQSLANLESKILHSRDIMTYQNFLKKLTEIADRQRESIQNVEVELEKRQGLWKKCHQRQEVLQQYEDRIEAQNRIEDERQEQKQIDQLSIEYWRLNRFNR